VLDPAWADTDLVPALAAAFPGFDFSRAPVDEDYWRDTRSVIRPDGTAVDDGQLHKDGGDVKAVWQRLKETDLQITEWRGTSAFVFAPTGPAAADYIQIALGHRPALRLVLPDDPRPMGRGRCRPHDRLSRTFPTSQLST